jgi:hypothetical protein
MLIGILLSTLIKQALKMGDDVKQINLGPRAWIREFRTITLGMPRRSGKTTALVELAKSAPSIYLVHNQNMVDHIKQTYGLDQVNAFRLFDTPVTVGRTHPITYVPITYVLVDEFGFMSKQQEDTLYHFINSMKARNLLDEKFMVVRVGT